MDRGELYSIGVSVGLHVAAALGLGWLAVEHVLDPPDEPVTVEFELVDVERAPAPAPSPPSPAVEPPAPEPPVPVKQRPLEVPDEATLSRVDEPRAFSPDGRDVVDGRDVPGDTSVDTPSTSTKLVFDMDAEITGTGGGSGRGDYATTSHGTIGVGPRGGSGEGGGGGAPGSVDRVGAVGVKVARDWEVTALPEPLNDRDFEPDYPPVAKREGREATVIVRLFIDADGKVVRTEIVRGPRRHGFRDAAVAYVNKLRFAPARSGKTPVASRIDWTVHFYVRN